MPIRARRVARIGLRWLAWVLVGVVVSLPLAAERAVEHARIDDRLGTLPVQVRLAHNGYTTLDTGILGKLYWQRTGALGFGASLRSTGPPIAGGTLASYVSPKFVSANARFLESPDRLAATYGAEMRRQVVVTGVWYAVIGGLLVGTVLFAGASAGAARRRSRRVRWIAGTAVVVIAAGCSTTAAVIEFRHWDGSQVAERSYPMPTRPELSFSSPQTREIAEQVRPFIEKNTTRIRERNSRYEETSATSVREQLADHLSSLAPREGEEIVIAEADPQGSEVGTDVRRDLYAALADALDAAGADPDSVVLRTIAGDISSNGTVAEKDFVHDEVAASSDIPVVAAKGDHDTDVTVDQLLDAGATVPDTEVVDAAGLRIASARDPAFKALFGGLVVNDSGTTEEETGAALREVVDDEDAGSVVVVLHQPRAVDGYLEGELEAAKLAGDSLTTPVDDGVPDLPPGIITYGHLHDPAGPWVIWNTDGDEVTWTVVTQLGTAGGVEENPTFNRFSTPFSTPLKALSVQLQYVNVESGLQTGYLPISFATDGTATVGPRTEVGLPGGMPGPAR
ncbi:hypothetical protein [Nocardioides sp. YIM 152315]|uniref:metallophosphoesterase family protein n=1 Tax=Nocardioides sp. YIM 152315 TaxID=3031760 RepID=UPI0023DCD09D|nr:hypothetical protein [Nocardioides sp. YIM 152315]MDF1601946.1 hypothetical protein [Nocardioides sp. YIM 152315]